MTRRQRQQAQVVEALERGDVARCLVLAREHLQEFPGDVVVRDAAARAGWSLRGARGAVEAETADEA